MSEEVKIQQTQVVTRPGFEEGGKSVTPPKPSEPPKVNPPSPPPGKQTTKKTGS
jgi:hypothetical protein